MKTVDDLLTLVRDETGPQVTVPTVRSGRDELSGQDALAPPAPTAPERRTGRRVPSAQAPGAAGLWDIHELAVEAVGT